MLTHPAVLRPADHAEWRSDKMGKSTIYQSVHLLVGLNAFEPGQSHALHAHSGMDLLVAPDGVPHGVKNTGAGRLLVLAVLAPAP
jgi:quercetin dioxygenase-like cupin family protein